MSNYQSIYWDIDEAKLTSYSANLSSRTGKPDVTVVKIALEVSDNYRLSALLDGLRDIKTAQETRSKKKTGKPLLLAYKPDEGGAA